MISNKLKVWIYINCFNEKNVVAYTCILLLHAGKGPNAHVPIYETTNSFQENQINMRSLFFIPSVIPP